MRFLRPLLYVALVIGAFFSGLFIHVLVGADTMNQTIAHQLILAKHIRTDISAEKLSDAAIEGMVSTLEDPYSYYIPREKREENTLRHQGQYVGIGAVLKDEGGKIMVEEIMEGGPASQSLLANGDTIVAVDGKSTEGKGVHDVVKVILGDADTEVVITVTRNGNLARIEVPITRNVVKLKIVHTETLEKDSKRFHYIRFTQFTQGGVGKFNKAVEAAVADKTDGVILDLRGNPGGLLMAAGELSCHWLAAGDIVSIQEARDQDPQKLRCASENVPALANVPTVVLVNKSSASASEIVAGALQDHKKSYTLGEKTFGKGVGQMPIPLMNGSALNLTTFLWYTPHHRSIHKEGITPDEELIVERSKITKENDPQKTRAVEYLLTQ